jgi:hypothetical protein
VAIYDVLVPFESLLYEEDPSSSTTARLPGNFDLPAMSVEVEEGGTYRAELHVEASSATVAKKIAVGRVEEFLVLQVAWNDGFRVHLRGVRATRLQDGLEAVMDSTRARRSLGGGRGRQRRQSAARLQSAAVAHSP